MQGGYLQVANDALYLLHLVAGRCIACSTALSAGGVISLVNVQLLASPGEGKQLSQPQPLTTHMLAALIYAYGIYIHMCGYLEVQARCICELSNVTAC